MFNCSHTRGEAEKPEEGEPLLLQCLVKVKARKGAIKAAEKGDDGRDTGKTRKTSTYKEPREKEDTCTVSFAGTTPFLGAKIQMHIQK